MPGTSAMHRTIRVPIHPFLLRQSRGCLLTCGELVCENDNPFARFQSSKSVAYESGSATGCIEIFCTTKEGCVRVGQELDANGCQVSCGQFRFRKQSSSKSSVTSASFRLFNIVAAASNSQLRLPAGQRRQDSVSNHCRSPQRSWKQSIRITTEYLKSRQRWASSMARHSATTARYERLPPETLMVTAIV